MQQLLFPSTIKKTPTEQRWNMSIRTLYQQYKAADMSSVSGRFHVEYEQETSKWPSSRCTG